EIDRGVAWKHGADLSQLTSNPIPVCLVIKVGRSVFVVVPMIFAMREIVLRYCLQFSVAWLIWVVSSSAIYAGEAPDAGGEGGATTSTTAKDADHKNVNVDRTVDFVHEIVPLLREQCGRCHTAGTYKGDLSMDTREDLLKGKAFVPGDSAKSEIISRVT